MIFAGIIIIIVLIQNREALLLLLLFSISLCTYMTVTDPYKERNRFGIITQLTKNFIFLYIHMDVRHFDRFLLCRSSMILPLLCSVSCIVCVCVYLQGGTHSFPFRSYTGWYRQNGVYKDREGMIRSVREGRRQDFVVFQFKQGCGKEMPCKGFDKGRNGIDVCLSCQKCGGEI